jgi:uncharacterized protein YqeY
MLIEKIRNDMHEAKKVKNLLKANLLSTLYAEIFTLSKSGKELTEEDEIKVIKKFVKNANETLALDISEEQKRKYEAEKLILESYLPHQLSREEVDRIVGDLLSQEKTMKEIMAYFKENFAGRYDGKTVNEIVRAKQGN